jgi:hypothetical protein
MWPRRLHWRKKPPKVRRMVRKRRPHRTARDRLRDFGLSRFRYLWFVPVLVLLIAVVASVRVPKTTTTWLMQSAAQSEPRAADVLVQSGKFRTSIPGGYRLAVDVSLKTESQHDELLVELILRDGGGEAVARQITPAGSGAMTMESAVIRAELDIPYNLSGKYALSVRVSDADGREVSEEAPLGPLRVY